MMYNLKHLKSSHAVTHPKYMTKLPLIREDLTFSDLKNTPEVQERLEFIRKFDKEISDTIDQYKDERAKRLETEKEVCRELSEHKIAFEKGTEVFLKMCEDREEDQEDNVLPKPENLNFGIIEDTGDKFKTENSKPCCTKPNYKQDFIKRNIKVVKEGSGMMANLWLTDEEKLMQQHLLQPEEKLKNNNPIKDKFFIRTPTSSLHLSDEENTEEADDGKAIEDKQIEYTQNAFVFNENESKRMNEIDSELEKFRSDQSQRETSNRDEDTQADKKFWTHFNSKQALKDINSKLELFYQKFAEEDKLNETIAKDNYNEINVKQESTTENFNEINSKECTSQNCNFDI